MFVKGLRLLPFVAVAMFTGASFAQDQNQFRGMLGNSFDLKGAVLSPAPIGPPSQFETPAAAAKPALAKTEPAPTVAKPTVTKSAAIAPRKTVSSKPRQKTAVAARKPKSNPLDSYARDVRRQSWPCTGGGICAWTQPR
jgi:hypothetical protein